jgi:hypothetical protein
MYIITHHPDIYFYSSFPEKDRIEAYLYYLLFLNAIKTWKNYKEVWVPRNRIEAAYRERLKREG